MARPLTVLFGRARADRYCIASASLRNCRWEGWVYEGVMGRLVMQSMYRDIVGVTKCSLTLRNDIGKLTATGQSIQKALLT
eukprot:4901913-Pyramimonas_sp.AAC.1